MSKINGGGASRGPISCDAAARIHTTTAHTAITAADTRNVVTVAFVFISQTRPCPTFGRPVHHWVTPLIAARYFSAGPLDSTTYGGHPALRRTVGDGFRSTLVVSSFRLRARLGFAIPFSFSGQRGFTPAFGYDAPHLSVGGTLTLLNLTLLST